MYTICKAALKTAAWVNYKIVDWKSHVVFFLIHRRSTNQIMATMSYQTSLCFLKVLFNLIFEYINCYKTIYCKSIGFN